MTPAKNDPASPKSRKATDANYSIDTVLRLKTTLKKSDRLFFLIGIDAFKDIAKWREPEALLRECEFIVGSRPGFSLADVANALPEKLRPKAAATKLFAKQAATGDLALSGVTLHLLGDLNDKTSATAIRQAVKAKRPLTKFVDPEVAEYIRKMGLYKAA
jgi:nicotinate-nucleotide adenylyltransferase